MPGLPFARLTNSTFPRFIIVGGGTALLYLTLLTVCKSIIELSATLSVCIAYPIAVSFNYSAHYYWTYRSDSKHSASILRYLVLIAIFYFSSIAATRFIWEKIDMPFLLFQVLLIGSLTVLSYVLQRVWVFATND